MGDDSTNAKAPLLTASPGEVTPSQGGLYDLVVRNLKYGSLAFLIVQNSSHVLLLRYSRICEGECKEYTTGVAVLFAELFKLTFCLLTLLIAERGPLGLFTTLRDNIWERKMDTLKVSVPAFCFTLQNNLQFVAASHLGAALLQLLYQTKTLSTAVLGVVILGKALRINQWAALTILVVGVVMAQGGDDSHHKGGALAKGNVTVGVMAALGVSICSGFASVYLEKILKGDKTSIWVRNVQLCLFSIPLQLVAIYQRDYEKVATQGWLHGFCWSTWAVVCMFAFGGLLVAIVIRFADNNLKNLAMALAILLSCLASVPLFDFSPNRRFWGGASLVITSIFLYAWAPKVSPYVAVADAGGPK